MGQIEDVVNSKNQREAEGEHGIHAAHDQTVQELLGKDGVLLQAVVANESVMTFSSVMSRTAYFGPSRPYPLSLTPP